MKRIRVYLDDRTAQQLEAVAPASGRKRSAFIRQASARALLELAEHRTRAAYVRVPEAEAPRSSARSGMRSAGSS